MQKVPNTKANMNRCICGQCTTYMSEECPQNNVEGLYCVAGKTSCDLLKKGCLCGDCPIWKEYKLSKGYFCVR